LRLSMDWRVVRFIWNTKALNFFIKWYTTQMFCSFLNQTFVAWQPYKKVWSLLFVKLFTVNSLGFALADANKLLGSINNNASLFRRSTSHYFRRT
jgi:hypothetical protein